MFPVRESIRQILSELPEGVKLVAVSKFHPNEYIEAAYQEGQRVFGESREQELAKKVVSLPQDIEWHFIGHLQTNKVKYIVPYISMIEAVDSLKLLKEINKQAEKCNRNVDVLLELHLAKEGSYTEKRSPPARRASGILNRCAITRRYICTWSRGRREAAWCMRPAARRICLPGTGSVRS